MIQIKQEEKQPAGFLIDCMTGVAMGMHYLGERGLIHRVSLSFHISGTIFMHIHFRTWQHAMFYSTRRRYVKCLILDFCERFPRMKVSMSHRETGALRCAGWLQRASGTKFSPQLLMCGAMGYCSGRCSTLTSSPTLIWILHK